jgi:predicted enzyme related to lactoylglutathione lyase
MNSIVHFEIPFMDKDRAKKFYQDLFAWKLEEMPEMEYVMISVDGGIGGGMMKRQYPDHKITDYFGVSSLIDTMAKVEKLGGKVIMGKTAVPKMGYFALCMDTENNVFGIFEEDQNARVA